MSAILTHEGSSEEQLLNNLGSNLNLTDEELQGTFGPTQEEFTRIVMPPKNSNLQLTNAPLRCTVYPPPSSYPLKTYDDYSMVNDPVSKQAQTVAEVRRIMEGASERSEYKANSCPSNSLERSSPKTCRFTARKICTRRSLRVRQRDNPFIHSFIHSFIHFFIHSSILTSHLFSQVSSVRNSLKCATSASPKQ